MKDFELINKGYNSVFKLNQLSIGIVVPIENYASNPIPTMKHHLERVQLIDSKMRSHNGAIWLPKHKLITSHLCNLCI